MSRSYKKANITRDVNGSDTWARRQNNKNLRRAVKIRLAAEDYDLLPLAEEVNLGDRWSWPTDDTKRWVEDLDPKELRK